MTCFIRYFLNMRTSVYPCPIFAVQTQKKKYFVLHAGGKAGGPRLEYHDTEKKYKTNNKGKKSILLQSCIK